MTGDRPAAPVFPASVMAMVLFILAATAPRTATSTEPVADGVVRLQSFNAGIALLDAGENPPARDYFQAQLRVRARPENVAGLWQATARLCGADSTLLALQASLAEDDPVQHYLRGAYLEQVWDYAASAEAFAAGAHAYLNRGDALSAAFCLLGEARGRLRQGNTQLADSLCTQAVNHLPEDASAERFGAEIRLTAIAVDNIADRIDEAEAQYHEILALARERNYGQLEFDALNGMGSNRSKTRRVGEAIEQYALAVEVAEALRDPRRIAIALTNMSYEITQRRDLGAARVHLERAREIAESCGHDDLLGPIFGTFGAIADTEGDRTAAADFFRQAVEACRKGRNQRGELNALQRLAYVLSVTGNYAEASRTYGQALRMHEELGTLWGLNWVLAGLALTDHKLGYLDEAESHYRAAMAVNQQLGDSTSVAWCLNSLGLVSGLRGDYRDALVHHLEAMNAYEELGDIVGVAEARASMGAAYENVGDYDRAHTEYEAAFNIASEREYDELLRVAAGGLATVASRVGRAELAEGYFLRQLEIAQRWTEIHYIIAAHSDLAEHYLECGRVDEAREHLALASARLEEGGQFDIRSRVHLLMARCAATPQESILYAEAGLALTREGVLPEREWKCLSDLGAYHAALGHREAAERFQGEAIETVESLRRNAGTDELRRHMLRPALVPYERMIELLVGGGGDESSARRALMIAERSKAQILANRLRGSSTRGMAGGSGEHELEERDIQAGLAFVQAQLQEADLNESAREELTRRGEELEQRFLLLKLRMAEADSGYLSAAYPEMESADELLATLRATEHMLSYFLGEEASYLFSADRETVRVYRLPPRAELEERVGRFLKLWRQSASLPSGVLEAAQGELFELLIGPSEADHASSESLVIVPDGLLHRLPFSILRTEEQLLVVEHVLFLAPSLRTLRYLRSGSEERGKAGLEILAVGASGVSDASSGQRLHPYTHQPVRRLPGAVEEARSVARLFSRREVLPNCDEASFKCESLRQAEIVHIAAHSFADDEDVRRSFIVLDRSAAGESDAAEDDLLQWHEVASLDLNASLVTLASCRSAGGVLARGEGVTGLTQAFLHAGSRSVLAAQNDFPDRASGLLMERFYRKLRGGMTTAGALRSAQLEAMKEDMDSNGSAQWAGFVLVGDGAVVVAKAGSWAALPWRILLAAAFGALALGLGVRGFCVTGAGKESNG